MFQIILKVIHGCLSIFIGLILTISLTDLPISNTENQAVIKQDGIPMLQDILPSVEATIQDSSIDPLKPQI